jgi:hypothetical protein
VIFAGYPLPEDILPPSIRTGVISTLAFFFSVSRVRFSPPPFIINYRRRI